MLGGASATVSSACGVLEGRLEGDVAVFRGVPYGTGARFAEAVAVPPWTGVRDAGADGPIAPQTASRVFASMGAFTGPQSENCLTLTIWAPRDRGAARPVLVFLHGGGFMTGAGSLAWYDGLALARMSGLIVVNINYRLGALGFLALPGRIAGNLAILDQELALRWVQANIAAFGGDPARVTVMGQSGGGHNIASLLTMKRTEGLFDRAILLSPPLGIGLHAATDAAQTARHVIAFCGLDADDPDVLTRLREVAVDTILAAQNDAARALGRMAEGDLRPPVMPWDGAPHPDLPGGLLADAARAAADRKVDVLVGWTGDEANLFLGSSPPVRGMALEPVRDTAERLCPGGGGAWLDDVRARRPDGVPGQWFIDLISDQTFRLPSMALADAVTGAGGRAFIYRFGFASPDRSLGACHCIDLPFVFGTWRGWTTAPILAGADPDACEVATTQTMAMIAGFAGHGDPGFPAWGGTGRIPAKIGGC